MIELKNNQMKNNQNITDDNQHYVPQFLLNNFHIPEKEKFVYLYYKQHRNSKIKPKAIKKICSEVNYFNIGSRNVKSSLNLDSVFEKSENKAPEIISKIISSNFDIKSITNNDKKAISEFIAHLYLRMYAVRKVAEKIVIEEGLDQAFIYKHYLIFSEDIETIYKATHASLISDKFTNSNKQVPVQQLAERFNMAEINLININNENEEFIITDSPVLYNPQGEVYLPISPKSCLHLHLKNHQSQLTTYFINEFLYLQSFQYIMASNKLILENINYNEKKEEDVKNEIEQLKKINIPYWEYKFSNPK